MLSTDVRNSLEEPLLPWLAASENRKWIALMRRVPFTNASPGAAPPTYVAGCPINVDNYSPFIMPWLDRLALFDVQDRRSFDVPLPSDGMLWPIGFSRDEQYFAFALFESGCVQLWWTDCASGRSSRGDEPLNCTMVSVWKPGGMANPIGSWLGAESKLLCRFFPDTVAASHGEAGGETSPIVYDTASGESCRHWIPGAISTKYSEGQFRKYFTSQLATVDIASGLTQRIGPAGLYRDVRPSPDGRYLLVERLVPPFSRNAWLSDLPRSIEVWDAATGTSLRHIGAVPDDQFGREDTAMHSWQWAPLEPATLAWAAVTRSKSEILKLHSPFATDPVSLVSSPHDCGKFCWTTLGDLLYWERDTSAGLLSVQLRTQGCTTSRLVWKGQLTQQQRKRPQIGLPVDGPIAVNEVTPVWKAKLRSSIVLEHDGLVLQDGEFLYLSGTDSSADGERPWLDTFNVTSGARRRVFQSARGVCETVVDVVSGDSNLFLMCVESQRLYPRFCLSQAPTWSQTELQVGRPVVSIAARVRREVIHYRAHDGRDLSTTVYLPDETAQGVPTPFMVWIYPQLEQGAEQRRSATPSNRYERFHNLSPLALLDRGFGVVLNPPLPVTYPAGNQESFGEQLAENTEALVQELVATDLADPDRIAIGGYCFGASSAALLLARTRLFRAGVFWAGTYNLTGIAHLFWPEARLSMSPIHVASRIRTPVLIMHGKDDRVQMGSQTVDIEVQNQAFFTAVAAAGGTARYVAVPNEGHWCATRESVVRITEEMIDWCERHVAKMSEERAAVAEPDWNESQALGAE